jgi:hypothetical protein
MHAMKEMQGRIAQWNHLGVQVYCLLQEVALTKLIGS